MVCLVMELFLSLAGAFFASPYSHFAPKSLPPPEPRSASTREPSSPVFLLFFAALLLSGPEPVDDLELFDPSRGLRSADRDVPGLALLLVERDRTTLAGPSDRARARSLLAGVSRRTLGGPSDLDRARALELFSTGRRCSALLVRPLSTGRRCSALLVRPLEALTLLDDAALCVCALWRALAGEVDAIFPFSVALLLRSRFCCYIASCQSLRTTASGEMRLSPTSPPRGNSTQKGNLQKIPLLPSPASLLSNSPLQLYPPASLPSPAPPGPRATAAPALTH